MENLFDSQSEDLELDLDSEPEAVPEKKEESKKRKLPQKKKTLEKKHRTFLNGSYWKPKSIDRSVNKSYVEYDDEEDDDCIEISSDDQEPLCPFDESRDIYSSDNEDDAETTRILGRSYPTQLFEYNSLYFDSCASGSSNEELDSDKIDGGSDEELSSSFEEDYQASIIDDQIQIRNENPDMDLLLECAKEDEPFEIYSDEDNSNASLYLLHRKTIVDRFLYDALFGSTDTMKKEEIRSEMIQVLEVNAFDKIYKSLKLLFIQRELDFEKMTDLASKIICTLGGKSIIIEPKESIKSKNDKSFDLGWIFQILHQIQSNSRNQRIHWNYCEQLENFLEGTKDVDNVLPFVYNGEDTPQKLNTFYTWLHPQKPSDFGSVHTKDLRTKDVDIFIHTCMIKLCSRIFVFYYESVSKV